MLFRELTEADTAASLTQTAEAFGAAPTDDASRVTRTGYGVFESDFLAAQAHAFRWGSYFGGVSLPTASIGNVTVAPEYRGGGTAFRLMSDVLVRERARGAVLSTLFGGAPALYRRLGFELIERSILWRIPVSAFAKPDHTPGLILRPGRVNDAAACSGLYHELARERPAAMDRQSASPWAPWERVTVAVQDDNIVGYLAFRTRKVNDLVEVRVDELIAKSAEAYRALLGSLTTWASVADEVLLQAGSGDPTLALLRGNPTPVSVAPYMLRILDVQKAMQKRRWAPIPVTATVAINDPLFEDNSGSWTVNASDRRLRFERTSNGPSVTMTAGGFALWFAGVARMQELRTLGLATFGSDAEVEQLNLLAQAPAPWVSEFF